MKYTPHPYQEYCIDYLLSHPAAGLFLKPGMGKTSNPSSSNTLEAKITPFNAFLTTLGARKRPWKNGMYP